MRLLRFLVVHAGDIVSRETLRHALWDESTFVEFDQGVNYCIRQLRIALRDDAARPIYIETVKKQGYRFVAPVERVGTPPPAFAETAVGISTAVPDSRVERRYWPWPAAAGAAIASCCCLPAPPRRG